MTVAARPKVLDVLVAERIRGDGGQSLGAIRDWAHTNLNVVRSSAEAIALLRRRGVYREAPRPSLILLDLDLPGNGGREVLAEVKSDPDLRRIPIVAFSAGDFGDDLATAYALNANCFVARPSDSTQFFAFAKHIEEFWLTRVRLPAD